jgi:hypothetical protein
MISANDTIGNRTRAVLQTTAPPRAPKSKVAAVGKAVGELRTSDVAIDTRIQ